MISLKPLEWLALQRKFVSKPRVGLELLQSGNLEFDPAELLVAKNDLEKTEKLGCELITWDSKNYPTLLKQIYDPPLVLLAKGKWPVWEEKKWVAVVGARKASMWGLKMVEEIVPQFVEKGFGIVSGLAYGVDASAHHACLKKNGVTWGVMGTGIDCVYPLRHAGLAKKMEEQGGVMTEFPFGTSPHKGNFPQRNRIISGLSQGVIIVEASIKSGSLISARFGLEQGREVFVVVPPTREDIRYEGNWKLLDEGATPLLENTGGGFGSIPPERMRAGGLSPTLTGPVFSDNPIVLLLKQPRSLDYLVMQTKKTTPELLSELIHLESEGLIKKIPGALWQSL